MISVSSAQPFERRRGPFVTQLDVMIYPLNRNSTTFRHRETSIHPSTSVIPSTTQPRVPCLPTDPYDRDHDHTPLDCSPGR